VEAQASFKGDFITVVGAVNMDISGTAFEPLIMGDSNPGRVSLNLGGVGRNIADNLSRLGASVRFVTVMGEDVYGYQAEKSCREKHIDLSLSKMIPGASTSTYLCINGPDGDVNLAVSDMDICRHISPAFLQERLEEINRSRVVVLDANLSEEAIAYLAENCTAPLFADPVSVKKAARLKDHLQNIFCIKPNRPEAEVLSGLAIRENDDLRKAAESLHTKGVKLVFISLGGEGVYYHDGSEQGILPCCPGRIENTTGCGDAFIAAASYGYFMGRMLKDMAMMGLSAAALCAEAKGAIREDMSLQLLKNKMKESGGESI
jgi:pseudouridine kinase